MGAGAEWEDGPLSTRSSIWLLWAALVVCWPLPLFGLEGSFVPAARYAQLASALSALALLEGTQGMVGIFLGLLWGHAVIYAALLLALAAAVVRLATGRLSASGRAGVVAALVTCVLIWGGIVSQLDTQFHHSDAHASLWKLYR